MEAYNEDLTIAYFVPEVNKDEFGPMAQSLKEYFARIHGVHLVEVLPCPIGDADVRFHSLVERERFLNAFYQFSPQYTLSFVKHDEGRNAKIQTMNREAWVMLMTYPEDAKNNTDIVKAVAGFGLLGYWHDTVNKFRVVVMVNLKVDADIPHGVVVSARVPPCTRSWTCPMFTFKRKDVVALPDEDPIPPNGPLFPLPYFAPRWMGTNRGSQDADAGQVSCGQFSVAQAPVGAPNLDDANMVVDDAPLLMLIWFPLFH